MEKKKGFARFLRSAGKTGQERGGGGKRSGGGGSGGFEERRTGRVRSDPYPILSFFRVFPRRGEEKRWERKERRIED